MKKMITMKKLMYLFMFVLFLGMTFVHADAELTFDNNGITTLDYYCPQTMTTVVNYVDAGFDGFTFHMLFDTGAISLSHLSYGSAFSSDNANSVIDNDYYAKGSRPSSSSPYVVDQIATTISIESIISPLFATTGEIKFVNNLLVDPTFGQLGDEIHVGVAGGDGLTAVNNSPVFDFEAYPCTDDSVAPRIYNSLSDSIGIHYFVTGSEVISNNMILGTGKFKLLVLDWNASNVGGTDVPRWYAGNNTGDLSNYVVNSSQVDTEYGVDGTSLTVNIVNTNPLATSPQNISNGGLTIVAYTGDSTPDEYTRHSEDRGYRIEFENASNNLFAVEKPVTITVNGQDNPHRDTTSVVMSNQIFSLNAAASPDMDMITPIDGATFQSPTISPLKFQADDSWAGVDTGTIKIEIPVVMSGATQLMTGHIYSGSELTFTLNSGGTGLGNAGGYEISLIPLWDFPSATGIVVSGFVADLAGETSNYNWFFETRPSCDFYGCNEILDIYIMEGSYFNGGLPYQFTGELLIATGTNPNSPYPYLTGLENNILMCGFPWTGAVLDANVPLLDSNDLSITGDVYTGNVLYITGLDFTYDPVSGIVYIH